MASTTLTPSTSGEIQPAAEKWLAFPVLLYLAAILFPIHFNIGTLNLNGVRLLLLLLIVPLTIRLLMGHYGRLLWTDILFFLHILWVMVAMVVNNPDRAVVFFGSQAIEFIGGYVLGRAFIRTQEDFIALSKTVVLLVCVTFPFALIESGTGRSVILNVIDALPGVRSIGDSINALGRGQRMGIYRAQVIFQHPILYGLFCGLIFPLAFVALKGVYTTTTRYALSAIVALCAFLPLSSGPLLAMILILLLIIWAWAFQRVAARWWLLFGLFVVLYIAIDLYSTRTPVRVFLTYATFSAHTAWNRLHIFEWGMVNVRANPLFGIGLNDWVRPTWMRSGSMDNFWLVNAVRYGIPGFSFLAVGYLIALWRIGRRDFDSDPILWQLRRGWMIAFIGLTFTLTTVHVWSSLYSFIFFIFGAGMWMMTASPREEDPARTKALLDPTGTGFGLTEAAKSSPVDRSECRPEASEHPLGKHVPSDQNRDPRRQQGISLPYTRFSPGETDGQHRLEGHEQQKDSL